MILLLCILPTSLFPSSSTPFEVSRKGELQHRQSVAVSDDDGLVPTEPAPASLPVHIVQGGLLLQYSAPGNRGRTETRELAKQVGTVLRQVEEQGRQMDSMANLLQDYESRTEAVEHHCRSLEVRLSCRSSPKLLQNGVRPLHPRGLARKGDLMKLWTRLWLFGAGLNLLNALLLSPRCARCLALMTPVPSSFLANMLRWFL